MVVKICFNHFLNCKWYKKGLNFLIEKLNYMLVILSISKLASGRFFFLHTSKIYNRM